MEIIFPDNLLKMHPQFFWLGGGELELKVGISVGDFKRLFEQRLIIGEISTNSKN